ncbi:MAG: energy-coupling factor ABC transporter permease [Deltaproteobacteria bacterium]|nr:energy-coupling factor ABC transporter permease [Deltaproteobacteria bacterium]
MHMADALVSPAVGGTLWAGAAGLVGYCSKKVNEDIDDRKIPLMGVIGAFIFAAQMINFAIPGTGSSGHLGGGLILAILLGPHAGFLVMASVLTIQALFFADGGLLALGCNIFNLGVFPCFVAYPLIYKNIVGGHPSEGRLFIGATLAAVVGLQLGAFCVVLQTVLSGISELPFGPFVLLMQPIHLAIGVVEGLATTAVVVFVWKARPEIIEATAESPPTGAFPFLKVLVGLLVAGALTGGVLSWFASSRPDGLEWAMFKTGGKAALESPQKGVHAALANLQEKTAFLPDYGFKAEDAEPPAEEHESWPTANAGTSLSGLVGGTMTLLVAGMIGYALKRRRQK